MTTVPAGAKKPSDRKPKTKPAEGDVVSAAEEAAGEAVREIDFRGETYTVDLMAFTDLDVLEMFERATTASEDERSSLDLVSMVTLMRSLAGDEGYAAFKAQCKAENGRATVADIEAFIEAAFSGN